MSNNNRGHYFRDKEYGKSRPAELGVVVDVFEHSDSSNTSFEADVALLRTDVSDNPEQGLNPQDIQRILDKQNSASSEPAGPIEEEETTPTKDGVEGVDYNIPGN